MGGTADHVHVLARMGRTLAVAKWVEELKTSSSRCVKTMDPACRGFAWQAGYGVFSVSASHVQPVTSYIQGQREHHRGRTFQDEYRAILKKNGVTYDERYVWN